MSWSLVLKGQKIMHKNKLFIHYILTKPVRTPIRKKDQSQSGVENKLHSNLSILINHTFRVETNRDKGLTPVSFLQGCVHKFSR